MVPTVRTITKTNMQTLITEFKKSESGNSHYVTATCGKTSAFVAIDGPNTPVPGLRVIVQNASHRVWRGFGRYFRTTEEALAGYKSDAVKAIIFAAVGAVNSETVKA